MFKDKLKKMFNQEDEGNSNGNKKKIENLVFLIVVLIITIVAINIIWNGDKSSNNKESTNTQSKELAKSNSYTSSEIENSTQNDLELKLEEILKNIQGVGEVKVLLNYSTSSEVVAMYNETSKTSNTEETDTSGGTRKIQETDTQKDIVYQEEDGEKTPITQKIIKPKIEGAIITAKGANDPNVKTNIIQAVEAVTRSCNT